MKVVIMSETPFKMQTYSNVEEIRDSEGYYTIVVGDDEYRFNKDNHRVMITGFD